MYSNVSLSWFFFLNFALFFLPTVIALIWAAIHHYDLPTQIDLHPSE